MLAAALLLSAVLPAQSPDSAHLVLIATTDLHGHVTEWDYVADAPYPGGLTRAATVIDSIRNQYPDQVILVDAGDLFEGDLFGVYYARLAPRDPHPVLDVLNGLAYDAGTFGEHEFEYGPAEMVRIMAGAHFPYVSGNIRVPGRDTLAYSAYTVIRRQGLRVGVTGFTTPGVMVWSRRVLEGKLRVARIEASAEPVMQELRKDADLAIVLAHTGLDGPSTYDTTGVGPENSAAALSRIATRPDLVIVGHSHRVLADSVLNGVHFVQPAALAQGLAVVHLDLRRQGGVWRLVKVRSQLVSLKTTAVSAKMRRRLADADNAVRIWAAKPAAQAASPMQTATARAQDAPAIQYITDVMKRKARADLASTTVYDLRIKIETGPITNAQVFGLYPPEYTLRAVRISGVGLVTYLEQSARYFYSDSTGRVAINALASPLNYDVVGGAQYSIDLSQPPGRRIRDLKVGGRPVQPTDSFTLALSSFRQSGGGNFAMLSAAPVVYDRGEPIRDLILADLKSRGTLQPEAFARPGWQIVPAAAATAARGLFARESRPEVRAAAPPDTTNKLFPMPRKDTANPAMPIRSDTATRLTIIKSPMSRRGGLSQLGAFVADAYRNAVRADLAIVSQDELRADLPAGAITWAGAAAILEPGHQLKKISMTGADLQSVFENMVVGAEPCCQLSGAVLTFDPSRKDWDRVKDVRQVVTKKRFEAKQTYTVVISDYLVTAGNSFPLGASSCSAPFGCARSGLLGRWAVEDAGTSLDAFMTYLRRLAPPVAAPEDARIVAK